MFQADHRILTTVSQDLNCKKWRNMSFKPTLVVSELEPFYIRGKRTGNLIRTNVNIVW